MSIESCMKIDDKKEALECVKTAVANSNGPCRPKLVLLISSNCEYCREQEVIHKEDISAGVIQKLNIDTEEGIKIVEKNNLEYVPALILLDCNDNVIMS